MQEGSFVCFMNWMSPKLRIRTNVKQHLHINVWLIQGWMRRGIQRKLEQTDQTK